MPATSYLIPVYSAYGLVSVGLTVWLARTLFRNGSVFLEGVFPDDPRMAEAINHLLVVGFYLVNLGYACLLMKAGTPTTSAIEAAEVLSYKLGALLLSLGAMHFCNLYLFHRIRRRARLGALPPPVAPHAHLGHEHLRAEPAGAR